MPKRGFETCVDIMKFIRERFPGKDKISLADLEFAIKRVAGISRDTVEKYKKALREFRWIGTDKMRIVLHWKRFEAESK